jgi:hypothetical protein
MQDLTEQYTTVLFQETSYPNPLFEISISNKSFEIYLNPI